MQQQTKYTSTYLMMRKFHIYSVSHIAAAAVQSVRSLLVRRTFQRPQWGGASTAAALHETIE